MRRLRLNALVLVAIVDVLVALFAPIANYLGFYNADVGLQVGAGVIAVATFTGVFSLGRHDTEVASSDVLRDAIAAAFVIVYLVIVSWSSFFNWLDINPSDPDHVTAALNPLTATFTTNFTALTGVVIAFYFGSKTVERVSSIRRSSQESIGKPDTPTLSTASQAK